MVSHYYTYDPSTLTEEELAKIKQAIQLFSEALGTPRPTTPYAEMVKGICDNGTGGSDTGDLNTVK